MKVAIPILFLFCQFAVSGALVWEPAAQTQVLFANRPAVIRQDIRNDGDEVAGQAVRLHMLQLSSSTSAPVPGWEVKKKVEVPARQTLRTEVDLSLPKVTSPTRFRLVWVGDTGAVLGNTELVGCPEDTIAPLRTISREHPLGIWGESPSLTTVLRAQGCVVTELRSAEDLKAFPGKLVLAIQPQRAKDDSLDFGRLAAQHAKEWGGRVVWLVESGNLPLSPEPAVCVFPYGQGIVVVSAGLKPDRLDKDPLNQLRLVWLVELALATEENRLLLLGRMMNL